MLFIAACADWHAKIADYNLAKVTGPCQGVVWRLALPSGGRPEHASAAALFKHAKTTLVLALPLTWCIPTCACRHVFSTLPQVMDGSEPDSGTSIGATNPRWLSPEVLQGERATFASVSAGEQAAEAQLGVRLVEKGWCMPAAWRVHACPRTDLQALPRLAQLLQDVFAMGLIMWELMTLEMPWAGQTNPFQVGRQPWSGGRGVSAGQHMCSAAPKLALPTCRSR